MDYHKFHNELHLDSDYAKSDTSMSAMVSVLIFRSALLLLFNVSVLHASIMIYT